MKSWLKPRHGGARRERWLVGLSAFVLWAAAAASLAGWSLRVAASRALAVAPTPPVSVAAADAARLEPDTAAVARALGAAVQAPAPAATVTPAASRYRALGIVAGARGGAGAAIIAVDGQPPRAVALGAAVEPGVVLSAVEPTEARLQTADGHLIRLPLPLPQPLQTAP